MEETVSQKTGFTNAAGIRLHRALAAAIVLLAASLLVGFSMGRWLAPAAAWFGPVLFIRFARDHKAGWGYVFVLIAMTLSVFIGFGQFFPPPIGAVIVFVNGLLFSLPYLADRLLAYRLSGFTSTFAYPLAATTLEFFIIHTNPIGTWGATGFSQYGNLALMQLASVTGMIGITFLMGWFAGVINWAWENRGQPAQALRGLGAFAAVLAAVYGFGTLRLNLAPARATGESVRVAGITANPQLTLYNDWKNAPDPQAARKVIEDHWEAYFNETVREAQAGAQLVVWPEASAMSLDSDDIAGLLARGRELARQEGIYLTIPVAIVFFNNEQPISNKLLLIDPSGEIAMEHVKYGGAIMSGNMIVGDGKLQTVDTPYGLISGVICWDMDYPATIQQAGRNGTGLLLVPSRDWLEIDLLHSQMAVFRAIENGVSVFRQVDEGLSIAADPYGRVLAQTDFFTSNDRTLVAQMPVEHVTTLYSLFGRCLDWLAPIGLLALVLLAIMARGKNISKNS